jgi:proliferating cell nuclear antigen
MVNIIQLKTTQTGPIKTLIDTLHSLLTDINITFYPCNVDTNEGKKTGGVMIKEVNKTQSLLIQCKLDADQFEEYVYNYDGPKYYISINLNNLLKCLKCMNNFDTLSWIIDSNDTNKLIMILENEKEKKTFKINLMDLEYFNYNIQSVTFPYCVIMSSVDFQKYCKDLSMGEIKKLDIKCTEKNLFLSGDGEIGKIEFELNMSKGGITIEQLQNNDEPIVQGLYELKYLLTFTKCTNLSNQVFLYFKNNIPLIVKYSIGTLGEIKLVLSQCKNKI